MATGVDAALRRVITAFTLGEDAERHFDLAAHRIQDALLTVAIPDVETLDIGVHAEPARLVGGDYIDLIRVGDRSVFWALGDASGKSLAAALTALMLRYLVRGLVNALGTADLPQLIQHVNAVVSEDLKDGAFITFITGFYDGERGELRIANAGHEPVLLLRADADAVDVLESDGLVLGVAARIDCQEIWCRLASGDLAVVYTDGLTEATNERGELYTIERLCAEIRLNRAHSAQYIAEATFEAVRAYSVAELRDDATILVIKVR